VIRLEDELVALLEEQPERSGADELEERLGFLEQRFEERSDARKRRP